MRFSIWPTYERPWAEVLELAQWADQVGWHGVWYADHYMPNTDDGAVADGPAMECWSMLAALAAATQRLRLGPLVSPTSVHHPALLAHRAATIDHISDGRFVLGLGAGWQVNEHRAYGIELHQPGDRVTRFAEAIEIVHRMLREQRVTVAGEHFSVTDAPCDPKPVQDPLPIMVGTGSPRMLRLTARWAEEWNTWGTPELARERSLLLDQACEREGRDPATIRRSVQAMVFLVDDEASAERIRTSGHADRALAGTSDQIADRISEYAALGFDEFNLLDATLGDTAAQRRDGYERFWNEVVPNVG